VASDSLLYPSHLVYKFALPDRAVFVNNAIILLPIWCTIANGMPWLTVGETPCRSSMAP
jgi:hypothetical protein